MSDDPVSARWTAWRREISLEEYHARFERIEQAGGSAHGEADFIESFHPTSVLDAGCGMGRVAIELHKRGIDAEGVDLDGDLLAYARQDAPTMVWHEADLAGMSLGRRYAMVAMPGNVMIFCRAEDRAAVVSTAAAHIEPGGLLVAGFTLEQGPDALTLDEYDTYCRAAGLELQDRYATWERQPYEGGDYAVSVHRLG